MELSADFIRRAIIEPGWQIGEIYDYADEYGEPGYSFPYGATTPMILLADWNNIGARHPRVWAQLESQGVQCEWSDEWTVTHDNGSRAYRVQPDSYSWQSSILYTEDGEILTPEDDIDAWIAEVVDNPRACLPSNVWSATELAAAGFVQWMPDDPQTYESGWHPGQTDDPEEITREIREELGDSAEVVFYLGAVGQFDCRFSAWTRGGYERISLSSNAFSTDGQLEDVVSFLETAAPDVFAEFLAAFPEWTTRTMGEHSSWFDTAAMGVDEEWASWAIDWIESHSMVQWEDGEPWVMVERENA